MGYQCVECAGAVAPTGWRRSAQSDTPRPRTGRTVAGAEPVAKPVMVPVLIALNVAVFLWTVVQAASLANNAVAPLFQAWSLQPADVAEGQWWRLFTAGFLHFGPLHLAFNMLALWVIGRELEPVLGRIRFLAIYLIGLLGGSAAPFLFGAVSSQVAGASGAVFGLMGGLAVILRRMRLSARPALTLIGINLVLSFVVPNISILGHLGGLVAGAIGTAVLVYSPARNRNGWQAGGLVALALILLLIMEIRAATLS